MSKKHRHNKKNPAPQKEPEQQEPPNEKDDRASTKELIQLATAITQLIVALLTFVIVLVKGK
ncbi:hypothetical protein [Paenibacillus alvei]|uniref:hypothetical protein n=1 Tax=Paenibacillus alvei TaxID=44250 RepID=UPI0013DB8BF6|nr:hypothetical protein [Paenibacillus alvei]MCY9544304.1 hypothetical protein [Paenibacillus alvei]MCY9704946.1 hypothetical protein [Paenibacillus alvei]MEC0080169.1 hypothetical protein [Paenibacillus alvei]NEZ43288.1 hypothetical protein [Paenibacillus alvei]